MNNLVQHHVKYRELQGTDEIVMMEKGEHAALHNRLRREGRCQIAPVELHKISKAANRRTKNSKEYYVKVVRRIHFMETLGENVRLHEQVIYNEHTGNVIWHARFVGRNEHILKVIDEIPCPRN